MFYSRQFIREDAISLGAASQGEHLNVFLYLEGLYVPSTDTTLNLYYGSALDNDSHSPFFETLEGLKRYIKFQQQYRGGIL